jgi:hypothetical protein
MVPINAFKVLFSPGSGWQSVRENTGSSMGVFFGHTVLFALVAPICGYLGTTQRGWNLGTAKAVKLTVESALPISIFYYLALLVATLSVAAAVHWMAKTYGAKPTFAQALTLASFTATPLFLVGAVQLLPELWLNLVLGLPALAWSVALFYSGVPVMLDIPPERGFLLASAVLAFGLVALVAMMVVTVLLWGAGFAPSFSH